jgi:glycosyltransferase involved in cell wall biosynthesis
MHVLQVIHDFLPEHAAGSEVYTFHLANALIARGHRVSVLTTEKVDHRLQYEITERRHEGLPVIEIVYNRVIADLEETYDEPGMEAVARQVLATLRPDLVHVQSLVYFGVGLLRAARALQIPVTMTLHEYHLLCPRAGLMYDVEGTLCETVTAARCSRCVAGQPLRRARYPDPPAGAREQSHAELGEARFHARAVERRIARMQESFPLVDLFISPSAFLKQMFEKAGMAPDRVRHVPHGFFGGRVAARDYAPGGATRFGFIGTLSEPKGVHLLVEAFCRTKGDASLSLYGELGWFPDYVASLRARSGADARVRFAGRIAPEQVREVLANIDVLVVPSLWYENSPLTIREAYLARVPVITTDLGGMREHVHEDEGGLLFPWNDTDGLRGHLQALIDDPQRVAQLAAALPPVRSIDDHADEIASLYVRLERDARERKGRTTSAR